MPALKIVSLRPSEATPSLTSLTKQEAGMPSRRFSMS